MSSELSQRINVLLLSRRGQVPAVQAEIARWQAIDSGLSELEAALDQLARHPSVSPDDGAGLMIPHLSEVRADIAGIVEAYMAVESRFSRETVNIGVSGSARVGKSTLLQSISGLSDEQIPTGRDIPVTAVRSRIYHSTRPPVAMLRLHSPDSFLREVIRPYHEALGMDRPPESLEEFRHWAYPDSVAAEARSGDVPLLVRLREMQQALWSYEKDLTGTDKKVRLEELRPYVAYPTSAERAAGSRLEHRYLAVRDVRIDCPFPQADVDQLGIVDLPGLGEVAAEAEEHHVTGLRHDVDVVLLVKRAAEGMAFWSAADAQAMNLLDEARASIRNRGDFVYVVINRRPEDEALAAALRADIVRQVNDGEENRFFTILTASAADPEAVRADVLSPLLHALANRLPVMDGEFLSGARERAEALSSMIRSILQELAGALSRLRSTSGNVREEVEHRAELLRSDLQSALATLVADLRVQATSDDEDPEYAEEVGKAYDRARTWIEGGFGVGEKAWCEAAVRDFGITQNPGRYGGAELTRIRVQISKEFAELNDFFSARVEQARRDVGEILKAHFNLLLADIGGPPETAGTRLLTRAAELLDEAAEPCPTLRESILILLDLRLEYRTQFHPRVREQLDGLRIQLEDPKSGEEVPAILVKPNAAGAAELYTYCVQRARQAASETRKALMAEKVTPLLVIFAATEHFEDSFIRAGDSEREFRRFAFSYRDELWPTAFAGLTEGHAHYAKVKRLMTTLSDKLA
jgi:hypothetical protein